MVPFLCDHDGVPGDTNTHPVHCVTVIMAASGAGAWFREQPQAKLKQSPGCDARGFFI